MAWFSGWKWKPRHDETPANGWLWVYNSTLKRFEPQAMTTTELVSHDNAKHDNRTRRDFIPVQMMTLDSGTRTSKGTTPAAIEVIRLADAATQGAYFYYQLRADSTGAVSSVQFFLLYSQQATAAGDFRITVDMSQIDPGNSVVQAGSTNTVVKTGQGTADILDTQQIMEITPGDISLKTLLRFQFQRTGGHGDDSLTTGVDVHGIWVDYTADM